MLHGRPSCFKVFLQIILAEDLVPVGQHASGRDGVEDADIGLRQVELLAALRPDEELLRGVGLDLPPITEFTETLREKGMALPPTILDTKEAALAIAKALQEKRTKG